tara:strand:+ start:324 stop:851 length:528 start_codon:yes stop_codon:yes gene_type:complete
MPQGSPKSVMAVDNPSHLTGNYARNAPRVQRQYTWRDPNQTQEERRNTSRGYNQNSNTRGGKKRRNKSRKKKGGAPVYGVSGYVVDKPQQYTFDEAKDRKIKHIWEASEDGVQVKDPYGFEAFKPQAKGKLANKKSFSKKGGKRKSRKKSRRKSRKKSRRKSRKGKKKRKSRRKR